MGLLRLMVLVAVIPSNWALPTRLDSNEIPGIRAGQPELVQVLALPTDEEAYNHLSAFPYSSGTHHFVSSSFPEIDARGFHESVFDAIGDYYPMWPKRIPLRGFDDSTGKIFKGKIRTGDLKNERKKRSLGEEKNILKQISRTNSSETVKMKNGIGLDNSARVERALEKRSGRRYVRGMEMGSAGFHGDTFHSGFGDFITMRRRRKARGSLGFHPDTFSDGFGHFQTMKKNKNLDELDNILDHSVVQGNAPFPKRRPEMDSSGFHGDMFGPGFGEFETMKKSVHPTKGVFNPDISSDKLKTLQELLKEMDKRRPEMDSMGFHGDTFGGGFGDFETMKKRRPEMDSMGFHGDTFGGSFGEFETMKKRRPEMDSMGFHGDTFGGGFGDFETMKKRRPEMDSMGFHGDTFGGGFGDFETMKKRRPEMDSMGFHGDTFGGGFGDFETMKKRRPEMDSMGFHGDTFGGGFGDFETMKKRRPEMDSMGFHGDTFGGGFGDFETMKKRRPEMDSMGFHGDTFGGSFGEFETMKKRRPEMDSMGFHGDTFGSGFGEFETMKKRRPEMDSMGFHGDTFGGGFGDFETMKKRRPEMDSMGFHGDTFGSGFGEFETMKKRRPEMDSMGFHGDTFSKGFGDFYTMKRSLLSNGLQSSSPNSICSGKCTLRLNQSH